jgi:pimeloyl-ACP methyl ester carboxylesterase
MQSCQRIRYLRTADAVQLAWAEAGGGAPLIKAANWLTHLEYEWESPLWRHWARFFSGRFRFIRYDERGCGMTDRTVGDLSFDRWVADLEAVADAAGIGKFILLGISQGAGTCVAYAAKHPDRVSRLVIYGGYVRGAAVRADRARPGRSPRLSNSRDWVGVAITPRSGISSRRGSYPVRLRSKSSGSASCAARPRHPKSPAICWNGEAGWMPPSTWST